MPLPFLKASLILDGTLLICEWIEQAKREKIWFTLLPEQGMIGGGSPPFKGIISCRIITHTNAFIRSYATWLAVEQRSRQQFEAQNDRQAYKLEPKFLTVKRLAVHILRVSNAASWQLNPPPSSNQVSPSGSPPSLLSSDLPFISLTLSNRSHWLSETRISAEIRLQFFGAPLNLPSCS